MVMAKHEATLEPVGEYFLRTGDLERMLKVCRSTIDKWIDVLDFPKPAQQNGLRGVRRWRLSDVEVWMKKNRTPTGGTAD